MSFKVAAKASVNGCIDVHKYVCDETGLTVVLAEVEGPVVNGYFVVVTEALDDDGLPHTLEHLIFLGSEKYPYKGILDLLANRCLASGTNAWTDVDHTCYTMTTAGSDGFLELMPIYLDHILYPTLTDSGYITEVHHISGEGEDAGVVYSEMKGRENTAESIAYLNLIRAAYPNSGYSSETGGLTKNLRTNTNNKKVRDYHAAFYRPDNLTIIITGKIEPDRVFNALKPVQDKIRMKNRIDTFTKPWQTPVPPIEESKNIKVLYPTDEEDCGLVYIGFRGPNCINNYHKITACNLLLRYLTDTSVSPLQKEFVETSDPYASKVSHSIIENYESLLYLIFDNVPIQKIDLILDKLKEILIHFTIGEEIIDMKRMKTIIEREILESLSNIETDPHDTAAYLIITDCIYGDGNEAFVNRLNMKKQLEYFLTVDEDYWINLLRTYLVEGNYVCIRAYPSIEEQERLLKLELDRIEAQRNELGIEGLHRKGNELKKAMETNERTPPSDVLTQVPVPNSDNINFHYLKIFKSTDNSSNNLPMNSMKFSDFPIYAEIYDIRTNFVYISITLNTNDLNKNLRSYLLLYLELMLESPIRKNDKLIPYEEVVAALERDTIASATKLGLESSSAFSCGPYSHTALLMLQIAPEKYETAVNWCHDLLYSIEFVMERIKVCASKMHNSIAQAKRKSNSVVRDLLKSMYYDKDSSFQLCSMIKQQKFLSSILKQLENSNTAQSVIKDLNAVREYLTQPKNVGVHIAVNLSKMSNEGKKLSAPWLNFINQSNENNKKYKLNVIPDWKLLKLNGIYPDLQGTAVGLGCVESSFLFHGSPSINDFNDNDLPALMLYLQYLTQLEGPLWKLIRGQGYAYGYNIVPRPHEGLLCATLYRATNVVEAFREMKQAIENHVNKITDWDNSLLESAKSSLIFEIIERERCVGNLVLQSLLASFKNVNADYNQTLVKKVNQVTLDDLNRVGSKYMTTLFSSQSKTAIVCHPEKVDEIVTAFLSMDRNLKPVITLEESILAK